MFHYNRTNFQYNPNCKYGIRVISCQNETKTFRMCQIRTLLPREQDDDGKI